MQTKNLPFFFLSFFLFGSVITGAIGYYSILFLYPLLYVRRFRIQIPQYIKQCGYLFLIMYFAFSASNFLNLIFPNSHMNAEFYKHNSFFSLLFTSALPKIYVGTGLYLILLYFISNHRENRNDVRSVFINPLYAFLKGSLWAGIFFSVFFLLEYFYKFDYRDLLKFHFFVPSYLQDVAFRRPRGFLANSLTLSSMCLAYFCFFYTCFCFSAFRPKAVQNILFFQKRKNIVLYTLTPAILFFFILLLTLGRTSVVIGFCILLLMPIFFISKKNFLKICFSILTIFLFGLLIANQLGYIERLIVSLNDYRTNGHIDNRTYFREIYTKMFLDKPWIGNGFYWIQQGVRDKYFVLLGYADLNERNYAAHNFYLEILASGGLFCLSIFLYGIIRIFTIFKMFIMRHAPEYKIFWVAFFVSIVANLFHAFTQNNFLEASTTYTYFYLFFVIFWSTLKPSNEALS